MKLFLMRHGEAAQYAMTDKARPLTALGQAQSKQMAHWLIQHMPQIDLLLISPYLRAQQTWQQMAELFPTPTQQFVLNELTPDSSPSFCHDAILAYSEQYQAENVLIIAHMPLLGYLVSELVAGIEPPLFVTAEIKVCQLVNQRFQLIMQQAPHTLSAVSNL